MRKTSLLARVALFVGVLELIHRKSDTTYYDRKKKKMHIIAP